MDLFFSTIYCDMSSKKNKIKYKCRNKLKGKKRNKVGVRLENRVFGTYRQEYILNKEKNSCNARPLLSIFSLSVRDE